MELKDFEAKLQTIQAELEAKLKKDQEKDNEILQAELKAVKTQLEAVKGLPADVSAEKLIQMQKDLQTTIDDFDKWQVKMNAFVVGGGRTQAAPAAAKSFAERLQETVDENHDNVQKFIKGEKKSLNLEIKAVAAVSVGAVGGTTNFGASSDGRIIPLTNTIGHIRNIPGFTVRPYEAATDYYFMKEVAGEGSIATVAEGGTKPQFDIRFTEASVKFEWIAGWMLMSRKAMLNIPGLISTINSRLPEKLLDVEDAQILYGTGTSPQIKGILVSGNFVAGSAAGATALVEKIINDITLLEGTHKRKANGIVLTPSQYNGMFINKAAGSGEYDLPPGVTITNGQLSILGVPVTKTTALTGSDYVVGDFQNGAELLVGEAMNIQFFEQDSTNVRTNEVTVRIEEYAALPVYGSNFFIKGSSALS